ncbi:MAG: CDP-diacylglycerol--glycerol-3-phosphate 3-phosphatidyltransferase [Actinobacteria bacterium]|nr:CDP-diacylglycerol--glycerol-3-phosphate 3-phosphatidyltransferase [Actinomycetota bacterium]
MAAITRRNPLAGLANKLTILRIVLVPVFMFSLLAYAQPAGAYLAAAIFTVAALTDTADGYVARFQRQITVFGKLADPLADKLLVSAALISLVQLDKLPAWIAVSIIAREFAVTGLRLVAAGERVVISASPMGRIKTVSQIVAIIAVIVDLPVRLMGYPLDLLLIYVALAVTLASGIDYFIKNGPSVLYGARS